jgi:hypothetical protein
MRMISHIAGMLMLADTNSFRPAVTGFTEIFKATLMPSGQIP